MAPTYNADGTDDYKPGESNDRAVGDGTKKGGGVTIEKPAAHAPAAAAAPGHEAPAHEAAHEPAHGKHGK